MQSEVRGEVRLVAMTREYEGGPLIHTADTYEEGWEAALTEREARDIVTSATVHRLNPSAASAAAVDKLRSAFKDSP